MPQDSYRDPRSVVLIVDEGSNPFELACVCEVFGARRRPEIGRELYRFRVVTPRRRVAVRDAMFTIGGAGDLGGIDLLYARHRWCRPLPAPKSGPEPGR
jgi:AraC family transcriptional activator FtrA